MSILGRRARRRVPGSRSAASDPLVAATVPTNNPVAEAAPTVIDDDLGRVPDTVPVAWELTFGRSARIDVRTARRRRWFGRLRAGASATRRAGG